ncbi:MAG: toll/interleukin-1 receptor domain-containing protein, partial [Bacteroidales bacterium]|nr:toll/interleukin-1 receptor domain-containing protein [Bacteroidales bacterium]
MQYKYFAFISYNSHDIKWGKRLQKKLEHYRMPATLCSERGWKRTPIKPVFFAPTDIQPGGLSQELQDRLAASRHLIVICSPHSAKSEWVGKEIEFFHQLGRTKDIHFFIVDGEPHSGNSDTECFNPVVEKLGLPEILGANIHEKIHRLPWLNRERAYVQLISKLLNVEFDTIWKRHRRQRRMKAIAWTVGALIVLVALLGVWHNSQPVDVTLQVKESSAHNDNLPPM